jgi:hypothetical protein
MRRFFATTLIAAAFVLVTTPAAASGPHIAVAPHLGVTVPQPFGDLGTFPTLGVDVGYILPFDVGGMERPLQLSLEAMLTAPGASGQSTHPMLGVDGGAYEWELRQRLLSLGFNVLWRFMRPGEGLSFHALLGPRLYLMETVLNARDADGNDFGQNRETNSEFGLAFGGGAEYMMGPGALAFTVTVGGTPLDQRITGRANTMAILASLGYRLFF